MVISKKGYQLFILFFLSVTFPFLSSCEDPAIPIDPLVDDISGTWQGLYDPFTWTFTFNATDGVNLFSDHPTNNDGELSGKYQIDSEVKLLIVTLTNLVSGTPPFNLPMAIAFSYTLSSDGTTLHLYVINSGGEIIMTKQN